MELDGALFGLAAAAAYGVSDIGGTAAARRVGSARTTGVVVPVTCVLLTVMFLATGSGLPVAPGAFLGAVVCGLAGSLGYFAFYAALRAGPVSIVSPVVTASGGLTVVFSVVFLGESPSALSLVAALVATVGVVLAAVLLDGSSRLRVVGPGVAYAVACLFLIAGINVLASLVVEQTTWLSAVTVSRLTNATMVTAVLLGMRAARNRRRIGDADVLPDDPTSVPLRAAGLRWIALLVAVAALECAGVSLFYAGIALAPTWIVALLASFAPLLVIVAGVTLYRERPSRTQWAGIGLVLVSVALLALG